MFFFFYSQQAYRHNLKVLQQFQPNSFPLKKYIVDVRTRIEPPSYLRSQTCFDLRPLAVEICKELDADKELENYKAVNLLNRNTWPDKRYFGLDDSQYEAFIAALTKQVAIIQGPPGMKTNECFFFTVN